jgi:uncharacterized protein YdhG (YjbR/CyaY superfamily)
MREAPRDVDSYLGGFPPEVREVLEKVRSAIREAVPDAVETISYGIPAYRLERVALYFAGFREHVSVYPAPAGVGVLDRQLERYRSGKGTWRFALAEPIPYALIGRVAKVKAESARERKPARTAAKRKR